MWIELDDSLITSIPQADDYQCMALDAIAASACSGRHVVYGSLAVIEWLQKQNIGASSRAICQRIKNLRPELRSLRARIEKKIIIGSYINSIKTDDNDVWYVSLGALLNNSFSAAVLITENHNDANIYKIAANHYKILIGVSASYKINLSVQGGGGNQIHPTFMNVVDEKSSFCLVITDTDKDYPSALSCETSRKCKTLSNKKEWIAAHIEVPARELENIIPFNLISDAVNDDRGAVDLHRGLMQIESVRDINSELLLYSDFKKGTTRYWACGNHGNLDRKNYWNVLAGSRGVCTNQQCDENCEAESKDACKCFLVSSLGEYIADKFLEYAKTKSNHETLNRAKTSANAEQWFAVGKSVFEWGIALPVTRS